MKTLNAAIFVLCSLLMISCNKLESEKVEKDINASSPTPTVEISEVSLTPEQKGYVESGNNMAFKFLQGIYDNDNVICSPLSLQYALSMVANGASGETLQEITDFLGYGEEGIEVLNQYCKILMEQLPAVDLDVTLKVVNGVLVNEEYPLLSAYENLVEQNYYIVHK
jgi:serpin B